MEIKGLNEAIIRRYSNISSYKKGEKYLKKGNILSIEQHGNTLCSTIQGDNRIYYETTMLFDKGGILDATCSSCQMPNWCEHIVATLLGVIHNPDMITHHLDLNELLNKTDLYTLKAIILKIAENNTDMEHLFIKYLSQKSLDSYIDELNIKENVAQNSSSTAKDTAINKDIQINKVSGSSVVDTTILAKKVSYIIKKYENRPNVEDAISALSELVDESRDFVINGDGKNALAGIESIISCYIQEWKRLDSSLGDTALFFEDLDMAYAKSILIEDITREDNRRYLKKIEQWQNKLTVDGVENAFVLSYASLVQGWDDPVLRLILIGEKVNRSVWGKNVPEYASLLTAIRLEILDIQKKYKEYLNLALHEGCFFDYQMMLIKLNRPQDVVDNAEKMVNYNYQALTLAEELRRYGHLSEAIKIAEYGLTLGGASLSKLAFWLSERYEALEEKNKAMEALIVAFREEPSLNEFLRIRELADKDMWTDIRNNLITELGKATISNTAFNISDIIDIFLHEGLISKAIKIVDKESEHYKELLKVLDAAIKEKPEWVINIARTRAEEILEQANPKNYDKAVTFLKKVRSAYSQTKMVDFWNDYKNELIKKHAKKPTFMALLEKL